MSGGYGRGATRRFASTPSWPAPLPLPLALWCVVQLLSVGGVVWRIVQSRRVERGPLHQPTASYSRVGYPPGRLPAALLYLVPEIYRAVALGLGQHG